MPVSRRAWLEQTLARRRRAADLEAVGVHRGTFRAGDKNGRVVHKLALLELAEAARSRLVASAAGAMTASQRDADKMLDRAGGLDTHPDLHRRLRDLLALRPGSNVIAPVRDDVEQTYRLLLAGLR